MKTSFLVPSFEQAKSSSPKNTLLLLASGEKLPEAVSQRVPQHLHAHPALKGERGARVVLHGNETLVIQGLGAWGELTAQEAAELGESAGHALAKERLAEIAVSFAGELPKLTGKLIALNLLKGMALTNYRMDEMRSEKPKESFELKRVALNPAAGLSDADLAVLPQLAHGIAFARDISELPANVADPAGIAKRFAEAVGPDVEVEIWDEKKIQSEGMGLLWAVGKGAAQPPRFLIARYGKQFLGKKPALYLVGKGVAFDTGGVNLKTGDWKGLLDMKKDMAGAAGVLGAMIAIAQAKPELPVVALTPLVINALGSTSVLPGDVIRSYSGKTVEIQNTDAEGRLILADALHFAVKEKADYIVDAATLTGACVVALGSYNSGLFSNRPEFEALVRKTSEDCGEPAWPLPMSPRYGEELKSSVADLANMGKGRDGGAILAAKFLERFVGETAWCHLDIAGTHDLGGPASGSASHKASGRMVHTFLTLAQQLANR